MVCRVVHHFKELVPLGPVNVLEGQVEGADDVRVKALGMQRLGDLVDAGRIRATNDGFNIHVAGTANLGMHGFGQDPVGAQNDGVRLDAQGTQRSN